MPEEEPEQEPKGFFVGTGYRVNGAKLTFDYKMPKKKELAKEFKGFFVGELTFNYKMPKKKELTKEQWRIAYWKLRNQYRQEQLSKQLNFNFRERE